MTDSLSDLITVRDLLPSERNMVLSNWKKDLFALSATSAWGGGLRGGDFWRLVNHVIDRVSFPSSRIFVGAHPNHDAPLCWAAVRDGEMLHMYVRKSIFGDAALAYALSTEFLSGLPVVAIKVRDFNPFRELERT